jgi:hypothetical protein
MHMDNATRAHKRRLYSQLTHSIGENETPDSQRRRLEPQQQHINHQVTDQVVVVNPLHTDKSLIAASTTVTADPSYNDFIKYTKEDILKWLKIIGEENDDDFSKYEIGKVTGKRLVETAQVSIDKLDTYLHNKIPDIDDRNEVTNRIAQIAKSQAVLTVRSGSKKPINLTDLLEFCQQYELNSNTTTIMTSFGGSFPLINREDVFRKLITRYDTYLQSLEWSLNSKIQIDKTKIPIPYIAAAPGTGKTKLLMHHLQGLVAQGFMVDGHTHAVAVTIGNGSSKTDVEALLLASHELTLVQMVYLRFLYQILKVPKGLQEFIRILSTEFDLIGLTLQMAIEFYKHRLKIPDSERIDLFLAIDEVQILDEENVTALCSALGRIMQYPYLHAINLFPIIAGTARKLIESAIFASSYVRIHIPLPPVLNEDATNELMDHLVQQYTNWTFWRTNAAFRSQLRRMNGYPRAIEFYLDACVKMDLSSTFDLTTFVAVYDAVKDTVSDMYNDSDMATEDLLFLCAAVLTPRLLQASTTLPSGISVGYLEKIGMIQLLWLDKYRCYVTTSTLLLEIWLDCSCPLYSRRSFKYVFEYNNKKEDSIDWREWEKFIWHYETLRLNLVCATKKHFGPIYVNDLYPFGYMSSKTQRRPLNLPDCIMNKDLLHQVQSNASVLQENQWNDRQNDSFSWRATGERAFNLLNAANASFADVFTPLTNCILGYPCKWSLDSKEKLSYEVMTDEIDKNEDTAKQLGIEIVSVISTGRSLQDVPSDPEQLSDNLVIIHKGNFVWTYGVHISFRLSYAAGSSIVFVNEYDHPLLNNYFKSSEFADRIIEERKKAPFKDRSDFNNRLSDWDVITHFELRF